jgi:hypothetical protein
MIPLLLSAMLAAGVADAKPSKYPHPPKEKKCNKLEYFKKCSEISHYRGNDYIVFHWHDEATDCHFDIPDRPDPVCTWVSQFQRIAIREGCEISWCKK